MKHVRNISSLFFIIIIIYAYKTFSFQIRFITTILAGNTTRQREKKIVCINMLHISYLDSYSVCVSIK